MFRTLDVVNMSSSSSPSFVALLAIYSFFVQPLCFATSLLHPPTLFSSEGVLNITLHHNLSTFTMPNLSIYSLSYKGLFPGLSLRVRSTDDLNINNVNYVPGRHVHYIIDALYTRYETNLHMHGLHLSREHNQMTSSSPSGPAIPSNMRLAC